MASDNPVEVLRLMSEGTSQIVGKVSRSVVTVNSGSGRGSGTVWDSSGLIVTCNHVVGSSTKIRVGQPGTGQVEAKLVGQDPYSDVAVLRVEGASLQPIEAGESENLSVGQLVLAIASPYNRRASATMGIVTSLRVPMRGMQGMSMDNVIFTDAKLNPGYSGGPLVDASGRMIGLNSAYMESRGIAIPVDVVKGIVEKLTRQGTIRRAHLGLVTNNLELPSEIAGRPDVSQDSAVMVYSVESGSPAKQAGVLLGDVVLSFDGKPVRNTYDLPRLLTDEVIGKSVILKILRSEQICEIAIVPVVHESDDS